MSLKKIVPITVTLKDAATAPKLISEAIQLALNQVESEGDWQDHAQANLLSNIEWEESRLQTAVTKLDGPAAYNVPTLTELLGYLRKVLQRFFPCTADPFAGATIPHEANASSNPDGSKPTTPNAILHFYVQYAISIVLADRLSSFLRGHQQSNAAGLDQEERDNFLLELSGLVRMSISSEVLLPFARSHLNIPNQSNQSATDIRQDLCNLLDPNANAGITATLAAIAAAFEAMIDDLLTASLPQCGEDSFLNDLENQILANIDDCHCTGSCAECVTEFQAAIDKALFQQLPQMGTQGALLSDIYNLQYFDCIRNQLFPIFYAMLEYKENVATALNYTLSASQGTWEGWTKVGQFNTDRQAAHAQLETEYGGSEFYKLINDIMYGPCNEYEDTLTILVDPKNGVLTRATWLGTESSGAMGGLSYSVDERLNTQKATGLINAIHQSLSSQIKKDIVQLEKELNDIASDAMILGEATQKLILNSLAIESDDNVVEAIKAITMQPLPATIQA
jgi:hypothetical protein